MYKLYIYDRAGTKLAYVKNLVPLDSGKVLTFSDYLSSYGELRFRIQTKDPIAEKNILNPYQNEIKLYRDNKEVWAGVIVNCPHRNSRFIEVEAYTYAWLFKKVQVEHSSATPYYREFNSGTIASNITTIFNEGKNRSSSPISDLTIGTIENPNYPWENTSWTFTINIMVRYEWADMFQVINSLADMSNADWYVTKDKVFNFVVQAGRDRNDVSLRFGRGGNVEDYDSPLDGTNMVNDLYASSLDKDGSNIIHSNKSDTSTYSDYGRLFGSMIFSDHLSQEMLENRTKILLNLNKKPNTEISLQLNDKALPFGVYELGDLVNVEIKDGPINEFQKRRVIGWKVELLNNGVEQVSIITNTRLT
jgi:hypothetical protein